ncbi:MAG: YlbF family regulator [Clostridia bacterium]|nr:YlbF family regulator [Clostridia bacterium]
MNIYDTAHRLASEIRNSDECVRLRELRDRAYSDNTNRVLLDEYKRLQLQLQMSMVGAAGQMPSEDMQRFQQLASLLYMNSDVQAYLMAEMQMQKTLADVFKILTEAAGVSFDLPEQAQ